MDQLRPLAIAAGVVSLAASLFALGAAVSSDEDGGDSSPATTVSAETAPATGAPGAGGSDTTAAAGSEAAAAGEVVDIEIVEFQFAGGEPVTVPVGTEVVWTNNDSMAHTVQFAADTGIPESPDLAQGDTYSFTFTEPGTYSYICGIHPRMTGTIVVEG